MIFASGMDTQQISSQIKRFLDKSDMLIDFSIEYLEDKNEFYLNIETIPLIGWKARTLGVYAIHPVMENILQSLLKKDILNQEEYENFIEQMEYDLEAVGAL